MKVLAEMPIGADGGKIGVDVNGGMLEVKASYPVDKLLVPFKEKFVDKLKAMIPGDWDDVIIEKAYQEAIAGLKEV